jgi:hypothetical protein
MPRQRRESRERLPLNEHPNFAFSLGLASPIRASTFAPEGFILLDRPAQRVARRIAAAGGQAYVSIRGRNLERTVITIGWKTKPASALRASNPNRRWG